MSDHNQAPIVSVLMPTYQQAAFIRRALESLRAQTLAAWELIVVDDGSTDETATILTGYDDARIHVVRNTRNQGLGAALNQATALARGRYLAYLPSDDLYDPDHLARLVALLDARPEVYLAYSGLRWGYQHAGPTLRGADVVGQEAAALANLPPVTRDTVIPSGNILALVQVLHRRDWEAELRWPTRAEIVSDTLEADQWRAMLGRGAQFAYAGAISCEWVDHPEQRHKLIAGKAGGLARYRQYFGLGRGEFVNFQPSRGVCLDERARYERFTTPRELPQPGGLTILLAGELGFNPERIVALEERGHRLAGLWINDPEAWDGVGPFPFGNLTDIVYGPGWIERVRALRPDVIYAGLNWQALQLIDELIAARLDLPVVLHFKEGPFICLERGLWPLLVRALQTSAGQIFITPENRAWFQHALDGQLDLDRTLILDGDLPKIDWMTDDWAPKLSEQDGEIHTVCPGRPLGLDPFEAIARERIHVHFYGRHFQQQFPNWTRNGLATGYMHLHPTVEPADWVRELSRYDAGWLHIMPSSNGGELRAARWDDLNLPARIGTYAAAGLPWILRANAPSIVAVERLARHYDIGLCARDFADLAAQLRDRPRLRELTANMRAARAQFAFDTHADELVAFLRRAIDWHQRGRGGQP
jgi:glycosyltransferase involved in cell wall biosynthesis